MKKVLVLILAAGLVLGLCACPAPEPPEQTTAQTTTQAAQTTEPWEWDDREIPIDKEKIAVGDRIDTPEFGEIMGTDWIAGENRPLANSYIVQKQESYLGVFYRALYLSWPDFRDELTDPGTQKIKAYYAEEYRKARATSGTPNSLFEGDFIINAPSESFHYSTQVYSVNRCEPYLSVDFFSDWYGGGAHGQQGKSSDVFDLRTGELLALEDIVDVSASYAMLNAIVEDYLRENNIYIFDEPFDIRETPPSNFRMTEEGLVLIYNPYEIAPYSEGVIEIPLPFAALGG